MLHDLIAAVAFAVGVLVVVFSVVWMVTDALDAEAASMPRAAQAVQR